MGQFQAGSEIPVNDQALTKDDLSQPRYTVRNLLDIVNFGLATLQSLVIDPSVYLVQS